MCMPLSPFMWLHFKVFNTILSLERIFFQGITSDIVWLNENAPISRFIHENLEHLMVSNCIVFLNLESGSSRFINNSLFPVGMLPSSVLVSFLCLFSLFFGSFGKQQHV